MAAPNTSHYGARIAPQPNVECAYSYILPPRTPYNEEMILEVTLGHAENNAVTRGYVLIIGADDNYASAIVLIKPGFQGGGVLGCRIIRERSQWIPEAFSEIPAIPRPYFSATGMNNSDVCVLRKVSYNRLPWAMNAPSGLVKEVVGTLQYDNGTILVRSVDSLKPLCPPAPPMPTSMQQPQMVHATQIPIPVPIPITTPMHLNQHHYANQQQLHQQQQHRHPHANGLNAN